MLGQKILQVYPDDEVLYGSSVSNALPTTVTGLSVRNYKSTGLKIITEDQVVVNRALREYTNVVMQPLSEAIYTPDTSHTFGIPNLTSKYPIPKSVILSTRRHSRYNLAEQSLISRSKKAQLEPSPEELKIQALEAVAANLSVYARDAQERVIQLRQRLADRSVEPECYQSLQRERWREERRCIVMEEKAKVAQEELSSLSRGGSSNQQVPDKRRANLVSFFGRSLTKASLQFKSSPLPQTRTMTDLTPLSLRSPPSPIRVPPLPLTIKAFPEPRKPLYARRNQPQQSIQTAIITKPPNPPLQSISSATNVTAITATPSLTTLYDDDIVTAGEGFASIYTPTLLDRRSNAEIIAELGDVAVPEYAMDLLDDLDYIYDEIPLFSDPPRNLGKKISFVDSHLSSGSSTPTERSPGNIISFATRPEILSVTPSNHENLSGSSPLIRHNKRHIPAVSVGSFFNKGQENERTRNNNAHSRHSLHVQSPSSEETRRPRRLLKRKSGVITVQPAVTPPPTPNPEIGGHRRTSTLVSRIRRPFSILW